MLASAPSQSAGGVRLEFFAVHSWASIEVSERHGRLGRFGLDLKAFLNRLASLAAMASIARSCCGWQVRQRSWRRYRGRKASACVSVVRRALRVDSFMGTK
jgi:hypothetical protein